MNLNMQYSSGNQVLPALNKGLHKLSEKNSFIFMVLHACEWCSLEFEECTSSYLEITFGSSGRAFFWHIGHLSLGHGLAHWSTRKSHTSFNDGFGSNGGSLEIEKLPSLMFYFSSPDTCICSLNLYKSHAYWKIGLTDNKWVWKFQDLSWKERS